MIERCYRINSPKYPRYGKRGIRVCKRWRYSFENFLADMGRRPSSKHTLDRKDNNAGYRPGNTRWTTYTVQNRNRSNNRIVRFLGARMTLAEAAERSGLRYGLVKRRLQIGWDAALALSIPAGGLRR